MDPFSQAALGAVAAQASAQHKLGFRVVVAGAIAGAMPDIDVFFADDYFHNLQIHRGITHSLFFAPVMGPLLGFLICKVESSRSRQQIDRQRLKYWMLAMFLAILSHPLLDVLTPYGTQLLLPFSDQRFALFAMPIIDPLYTFPLFVGIFLAWRYRQKAKVHMIGYSFLILSSSYLGYGWYLGQAATAVATKQLHERGIDNAVVESFPTFLQVHYRRVVARTPTADWVGYISMWRPCTIEWGMAEQSPQSSFAAVSELREVKIFEWFAMGWLHKTVIEREGNTIYQFADLRYGLVTNPKDSFFSLNVIDTGQGFQSNTQSPISNSGEISARLDGLAQSAYPNSCERPSLASL
ncbi:MAG: inner membrane protein [Kiritimatiellia bacterium]|jgi:inner membrane protein